MDDHAAKEAVDASVAANAQAVRGTVLDSRMGLLQEFPQDFEATPGMPKKPPLTLDAIQETPLNETAPPELRDLAKALQQLCEPGT